MYYVHTHCDIVDHMHCGNILCSGSHEHHYAGRLSTHSSKVHIFIFLWKLEIFFISSENITRQSRSTFCCGNVPDLDLAATFQSHSTCFLVQWQQKVYALQMEPSCTTNYTEQCDDDSRGVCVAGVTSNV